MRKVMGLPAAAAGRMSRESLGFQDSGLAVIQPGRSSDEQALAFVDEAEQFQSNDSGYGVRHRDRNFFGRINQSLHGDFPPCGVLVIECE